MVKLFQSLSKRWKQYKYRFVPWIALNLRKRKLRAVDGGSDDKVIPDSQVEQSLLIFFTGLSKQDGSDQMLDPKGQSSGGQTLASKRCALSVAHTTLIHDCFQAINKKKTFLTGRTPMRKETSYNEEKFRKYSVFTDRESNIGLLLSKRIDEQVHAFYSFLKCLHRDSCFNFYVHQEEKVMRANHLCEGFPEHTSNELNSGSSVLNLKQKSKIKSPTSSAIVSNSHNRTNHHQTVEGSRLSRDGLRAMHEILGFTIERRPSTISGGGTGVFVTRGVIPARTAVAVYPGTVYTSWEPILLQSLANPFIFRCLDGTLIDGNDKGLSRMVYRSCAQRDRVGPYLTSDLSWLSGAPANPMAVGQYVNNQNQENPANVAYQEFDVPQSFPFHLLKYFPNVFYSSSYQQGVAASERLMRTVVLVSLRQIDCGEELFSSYFTIVH